MKIKKIFKSYTQLYLLLISTADLYIEDNLLTSTITILISAFSNSSNKRFLEISAAFLLRQHIHK